MKLLNVLRNFLVWYKKVVSFTVFEISKQLNAKVMNIFKHVKIFVTHISQVYRIMENSFTFDKYGQY